jgi:lysocardiolipin and lysophospholipid acyltransferase
MRVAGVVFTMVVAWTATIAALVAIGPFGVCFGFVAPSLFQRATRFVQTQWLTMVSSLVERMLGVEMVFSGDHVDVSKDRRVVVISNHRTRLDWMFLWSIFARYKMLTYLKIVLKAGMRKAPIFGWIMESLGYIFLSRSSKHWKRDSLYFTDSIRASCKCVTP